MEEMKLQVRINGEEVELAGEQARKVHEYSKNMKRLEEITDDKKIIDKELKSTKLVIDKLFTDSERRNENNNIEIMSITGKDVVDSYEFKTKKIASKAAIDKKSLISMISSGIQDGWITINSEEIIDYLLRQQYDPGMVLEDLDVKLESTDFTKIVEKTKTIQEIKEEIQIEKKEKNNDKK